MRIFRMPAATDVGTGQQRFPESPRPSLGHPLQYEVTWLRPTTRYMARQPVYDASAIQARLEELTDREKQVLSGVVAGFANKTIAYDLNISPRTVEVHRANVMAKMKARSLPELVRMALNAKLDIG